MIFESIKKFSTGYQTKSLAKTRVFEVFQRAVENFILFLNTPYILWYKKYKNEKNLFFPVAVLPFSTGLLRAVSEGIRPCRLFARPSAPVLSLVFGLLRSEKGLKL